MHFVNNSLGYCYQMAPGQQAWQQRRNGWKRKVFPGVYHHKYTCLCYRRIPEEGATQTARSLQEKRSQVSQKLWKGRWCETQINRQCRTPPPSRVALIFVTVHNSAGNECSISAYPDYPYSRKIYLSFLHRLSLHRIKVYCLWLCCFFSLKYPIFYLCM